MTFKTLIARDWRGSQLSPSPRCSSIRRSRSRPAAAPAAPAAPAIVVNKGDNAWMLTSTVLVLLMTIPGLALFYGGLVRPKNMLSVLTHVFYTVCIVTLIWVIYGYSLTFTGGSAYHRRLRQDVPEGRHDRLEGRDLLGRRQHHRAHLHLLPDDLRRDHARADRRRLRRAHEVLGGGAVHPALGDAGLLPDRAHGLVLGRPGRDRRRRQGARRRDRRRRQEGRAGQARRGHGRRRPDLPVGRDRLRRRHRGAHQRRHRRPGRRARASASAPASARS